MKSFKNKKAITLVELIISITISSILFLIIFVFITDSMEELVYNDVKMTTIDGFFEFKDGVRGFIELGYSEAIVLTGSIDWSYTGVTNPSPNDVLYLKKPDFTGWVIIWIVDLNTKKIQKNYSYGDNFLWYRTLSEAEVVYIESDGYDNIYDKVFFLDKIFKWFRIKDFRVDLYNWNIIDMYISAINIFDKSLFWLDFNDFFVEKLIIEDYNLVF